MLITEIVAAAAPSSNASSFTQASFVVLWLLIYYLTVGPVCYDIVAEVSAGRLRNKSVCSLSRISCYISQIIRNVVQPQMINAEAAN